MSLSFEWDQKKAEANVRKHGISFEEATTVFADTLSSTISNPDHSSSEEERFVTVGSSHRQLLLVVVHCDRGMNIRIISARRATRAERRNYEEKT